MTSTETPIETTTEEPSTEEVAARQRRHLIQEAALNYAEALRAYQKSTDPSESSTLSATLTRAQHELVKLSGRGNADLSQNYAALTADLNAGRLATSAITAERDALSARNDQLRINYNDLSRQKVAADSQLESFKEKVVQVASRYADEHGWCGVIDEALEELGLERAPKEYSGTLTITVEFRATLASRRDGGVDESWVLDSIQGKGAIRDAIRGNLAFDSDHESGSVSDVSFEVTHVEMDD